MKPYIVCLIMLAAVGAWAATDETTYGNALVSVSCTYQPWGVYQPWQKLNIGSSSVYGCFVREGLVATLAYPLKNHVMVELTKAGSNRRVPGEVVYKDYSTNLAFIRVTDPAYLADMQSLPLFGPLARGSEANVVFTARDLSTGALSRAIAATISTDQTAYVQISAGNF